MILFVEAVAVYLLVLGVHSLRRRVGLGPFYALLGGLTILMSWITDAGVRLEIGDLTFIVGSTVFYTAILLGVFVVYAFDGPGPTRIAILTVAGLSILAPSVAATMHALSASGGGALSPPIPLPSLRINAASVLSTTADMLFLAIAWEFMGKPRLGLKTWQRAYLTLLGVMLLDVFLFATGAFAGTPEYLSIMGGTLATRLIVATLASPILFAYLSWQNEKGGTSLENRPVLAIFMEAERARADLDTARLEIARREAAERELEAHRQHLSELVEERTRELTEANIGLEAANEAKRLFLANMSHELRTPLNSIIGFSGTLNQGMVGPLTPEQQTQVEMINNSGRYLLSLIEGVLDLSKVEAGQTDLNMEVFDPDDLIQEVANMVRPLIEDKGLELHVISGCDECQLRSDRGKTKQILLNLLSNAIKFTEAGFVEIRSEELVDGRLAFSVRDSGPGIAEIDRSRVFETFTQIDIPGTAKPKGTGLGLSLSRVYAQMLEGDIEVKSEVGAGSTFTFTVAPRRD